MYSEYAIPFGIGDANDENYFIEAIDNDFLERSEFSKINDYEAVVSNKFQRKKCYSKNTDN